MAYSSFGKYGKNTEAERNAFKAEIDKVAKGQQNYLDFWSRLATDKVRNQPLKSNNMVPTPVLITKTIRALVQTVTVIPTVAKMSLQSVNCMGPTDRYHATDWRMGSSGANLWKSI